MITTYKGAFSASLRGQVFPCLLLCSGISLLSFSYTQCAIGKSGIRTGFLPLEEGLVVVVQLLLVLLRRLA